MENESTCKVCGRPQKDWGCSEFCAETSDSDKVKFLTMVEGDWGLWPCPDCGCVMEDAYARGSCCSGCAKHRKIRVRGELLRECLPWVPGELAEKIRKAIDN